MQASTHADCIPAAFEAGINYFFSYSSPAKSLHSELKPLLHQNREALLLATGSESRDRQALRQFLDQMRQTLNIDWVDVFFAEYLSSADSPDDTAAVLAELHTWKTKGLIRYVGASTHNRAVALKLLEQRQCDVLMHRYNMAHRKAETDVLPAAQAANTPVIAFTCTRWGSLLENHPDWNEAPPTAADCYRYVLHNPAVTLALMAPKTRAQLAENLTVLDAPPLDAAKMQNWQHYGDLIYGNGQDNFETQWP
jgi:aryl-alcohol dehydrogenase-like predicted oxidoreductase